MASIPYDILSGLNICSLTYTFGTENYSFDNITTDLTRCPVYPAVTRISAAALGGTFTFQIAAQLLASFFFLLAAFGPGLYRH